MLNLVLFFSLIFAPHTAAAAPAVPAAIVAPAPAPAAPLVPVAPKPAPVAPVPVSQGGDGDGPQPVGPSVTITTTDCTVTYNVTQTDPQTGIVGTYPITYNGSCSEADLLSAQFGVPVTQSAPFTYTTGG